MSRDEIRAKIFATKDDHLISHREWLSIKRHGISLDYAQQLVDDFRLALEHRWTELLEDK